MMHLEMSWARHLLVGLREHLQAAVAAVEAGAGILDAVETAAIPPAAVEAMRNERLNRQSVDLETVASLAAGDAGPLCGALKLGAIAPARSRRRIAAASGVL
jgi:hypothetical protein